MRVYRRASEAEARAQPFLTDVESIHNRLRRKMQHGLSAPGPEADAVRRLLEGVLATELAWARRYRNHYRVSRGRLDEPVQSWFLEHALEEQKHAERVAARIQELGGQPRRDLADGSDGAPSAESGLAARVREDLVAERVTIGTYRELIRMLGDRDPATKVLLEEIVTNEEVHAEGLLGLLRDGRLTRH
jgi:bacterioferritin